MFEESLLESTTALAQRRNRWPVLVSFGLQASLAIAVVSIPILHPEAVSLKPPRLDLVAPTLRTHEPPPPQPQRIRVETATTNTMTAPSAPQTSVPVIQRNSGFNSEPSDAPATTTGLSMNSSGPALPFSANPGGGSGPHVVAAEPAAHVGPTSISEGVTQGHLFAPIRPEYPAIARAVHAQGIVIVEAVISKDGRIESAHVVSGPPLLRNAALEAVEKARYQPFLLNHQPTEVETTITINFRMDS